MKVPVMLLAFALAPAARLAAQEPQQTPPAQEELRQLARALDEPSALRLAECPRERKPIERSEHRARDEVRRQIRPKRACRLPLGNDPRNRVEIREKSGRGELG